MAPMLTRESLESLKRVDLQKLCKSYGVKANLKTEALVDLVLDAVRKSSPEPPSQPQRSSSTRIVSTRSGGRTRLRSGGSVVIHDTDEEGEENAADEQLPPDTEPKSGPPVVTRTTRKAKETQYRLGVGRPKAAGGAGPRAVTKSISVSKAKRTSKSIKIPEDIIPEELEPEPTADDKRTPPAHAFSSIAHDHDHISIPPVEPEPNVNETQQAQTVSIPSPRPSFDKINEYINEIVQPLLEQIQSFKSELGRLNMQVAELLQAKTDLTNEVEILRGRAHRVEDQMIQVKERISVVPSDNMNPSMRHETNEFSRKPVPDEERLHRPPSNETQPKSQEMTYPLPSSTTLGKRQRDSSASDLTGIIDASGREGLSEEELAKKVVRPQKKRPKLSEDEEAHVAGVSHRKSVEEPNGRTFTVFSGPEERSDYIDPPPPTTHLSDLFGHPPVTPGGDVRTNSANAVENNHPFGLSFSAFQAVTSTPVYASNVATYLDRPESPTSHVIERAGRQDRASPFLVSRHGPERIDQDERLSPHHSGELNDCEQGDDPLSALLKTPPLHAVREPRLLGDEETNTDIGFGVEMSDVRMEDTPAPPIKRTRYGTELETDTRFGDFGLEGIVTGFWQTSQRRL